MTSKILPHFALLLLLAFCNPSADAAPLRVVCIGDSIAQGRGNRTASGNDGLPTDGWRYAFWKDCVEAGHPIKFVGSTSTGFESTPVYADCRGRFRCGGRSRRGQPGRGVRGGCRAANRGHRIQSWGVAVLDVPADHFPFT